LYFVNAFERRLLASGSLCAGYGYLNFQTIERTTESDATGRAGSMAMETALAGRNDRSLELKNVLVRQTRCIRKIPGGTSDGGN
jgi:hypothetical protein